MTPDVFTVNEVAQRWRCSVDIVYDLLKGGKLKGFKLGGTWRVSADAIRRFENTD